MNEQLPRDKQGKFISNICPNVNCSGVLVKTGFSTWECNGLVDPNHADQELFACTYTHYDGVMCDD
jgi:hypothetical protein